VGWLWFTNNNNNTIPLNLYFSANALCAQRNGLCSTFCLPQESSKICACQDGVSLLSDRRTCIGG